ncbi:hypothetical protein V2O64_00140 [Verrucomicrobiaceae bacterium 227]
MNPVLPLPILIPLLLAVVALGTWLSWRSSEAAPTKLRRILTTLRTFSLLALALFLLNPGKWKALEDEAKKVWVCLVDDSRSMSAPLTENEGLIRSAAAVDFATSISQHSSDQGFDARTFSFGDSLLEQNDLTTLKAEGQISDLATSSDQLLTQLSAQGESLAGVVILSDGRQTATSRDSDFTLRAQALGVPFYAIPIGGQHATRDLEINLPRRTITVFPTQQVQVTVAITSKNLDETTREVEILSATGEQLATAHVDLASDEITLHTFSIEAPDSSTNWTARVAAHSEETRTSNNSSSLYIRVLQNKARIFLAEGAPYWDSKFLAQLLRQQEYMDVHSVHRLSDTRWFRVDSGESKPHQSGADAFPDTAAELKSYDLIVFGKNAEHFINDDRATHLRAFVKDQGGAVLFARSKPYNGKVPGLEPLEPVEWATGLTGEFQLKPSADGQTAGLFGQALPAPDSAIWGGLPKLKDAHLIDIVKPFTRVLAHGSTSESTSGQFPLLMVRRYGQGVTGLVNADGLWKWDFYPDARELGNMYQEYWIQLIYWMLSYSEFLPGQDYSLNLSSSSVQPGIPVAISMAYRGNQQANPPTVEITSSTLDQTLILSPGEVPTADGSQKWSASFTPESPGTYNLRLVTEKEQSLPEASLVVNEPPSEMDELSADPAFLDRFTSATGGRLIPPDTLATFLTETIKQEAPEARDRGVFWESSWMRWFIPPLLIALLAAEWFLRRRNGLI